MAPVGDFDRDSTTFLKWFQSLPGGTLHHDLKLADLRGRDAGRGIIATKDIPADTVLFSIPREYIITVENSDLSKKLPQLFTDASEDTKDESHEEDVEGDLSTDLPRPWLNLIITLIYEHFHNSTSRWSPYLSILPTSDSFNSLMFWSEPELSQLQASAIRHKIGKSDADKMFSKHIIPVIKAHSAIFYPPSSPPLTDEELLALSHRMGSIIMAYAFDLEPEPQSSDDEDEDEHNDGWTEDRGSKGAALGMVAMADMLNADASFNAHLSHEHDKLTMASIRTIGAGEEVLNYYGPLANAELLRRYGYTSPLHTRYDVVEIAWTVVEEAIRAAFGGFGYADEKVKKALRQVGQDEESFVFEREAGDPNDEGVNDCEAKVVALPEDLVEVVNDVVMEVVSATAHKDGQLLSKQWVLAIVKRAVEIQLGKYETTVEEDEKLLRTEEAVGRLKMAIDVRSGEKRLLKEILQYTEKMIGKYGSPEEQSNGQPPAKKLRRGK